MRCYGGTAGTVRSELLRSESASHGPPQDCRIKAIRLDNEQTEKPPERPIDRALQFLYGRINYERQPTGRGLYPFRLARMRRLLRELGDPDTHYVVVHIGGTKGKGSTSTMVAAMLTAGGLRTGLYTSPHLNHLGERFRVDGVACGDEELVDRVAAVREATERMEQDGKGSATFFELTTAVALLHFQRSGCQTAVLEVGLGGRLDSTNVCHPRVSAITSVGLDHQHILGDTVAEIAAEKAGILKPGVPAISGVADGPAREVIEAQAHHVGAPVWRIGRDFEVQCHAVQCHALDKPSPNEPFSSEPWGTTFDYRSHVSESPDRLGWRIPLEGEHQGRNAGVALAIIDALAASGGPVVSLADQRRGLSEVVCDARTERFDLRPTVLLDAAHNTDSIAALCDVIRRRRGSQPVAIVFGTSHDKDAAAQLFQLIEATEHLILTRFHENPRWRDPAEMAAIVEGYVANHPANQRVTVEQKTLPTEALQRAQQAVGPDGLVVVCGSFFLAAELRPLLLASPAVASPT